MSLRRLPGRDERGVALVIALLTLLVISMLSIVLMASLNVETKISGHGVREGQALNAAEAGIGEALARIKAGDVPNNTDPHMVAQIFLAQAGNVPPVGADTTAMPTAQPNGSWITYSSPNKGPDVLTVEYKTDVARTVIYRYDPALANPVQTASGAPIFKVTATGRRGTSVRRVVTEVIQTPLNLNMKAAMAADVKVKFNGNAVVCGFNHRADTPTNKGDPGRSVGGGCNEAPGAVPPQWEVAGAGNQNGVWTTGAISNGGGAQAFGSPSNQLANQTGFYAGPWEALGMTQAQFFAWVGARQSTIPANLNGIYYLDNNAIAQDQSADFAIQGGTGSGFLYVDGRLHLNNTFTYRGMIYVEGDLEYNGSAWVLGGVIIKGETEVKANGAATILYSYDSIQQNIAKAAGTFVTLSWREL